MFAILAALAVQLHAQIEGDRAIQPISSNGDFEVGGIEIDVSAENYSEARQQGWREAQRLAWRKLWAQTNGGSAPALSDGALDRIVSAIVIEDEQIGPNRYVAQLGVTFDRARAGQILGVRGRSLRSAPMLVMPLYNSGGSNQMLESRSAWHRAWAQYRTGESAIDYVRPSGAGSDSILLTAGQIGRVNRSWWRVILDQFGAADVIIPVANIKRQWPGGPIKGEFAARFGPDSKLLGQFELTAQDSRELPSMLAKAIARLDLIYTRALQQGRLKPDTSLIIETPQEGSEEEVLITYEEEGPISEAPAGIAASTATSINVQFATPDSGSVNAALALVRSVPGVQSASTASLALGGTSVMRVSYNGDQGDLAAALAARGWRVQQGAGALRISRGNPAPAAPSGGQAGSSDNQRGNEGEEGGNDGDRSGN